LPIVTTTMQGCGEVVRDGQTGVLVPPREPRMLAGKILDLLGDRTTARAMGTRARDLVKREFSLALVVSRYAALYAELFARSGRSLVHARSDGLQREPRRQDAPQPL